MMGRVKFNIFYEYKTGEGREDKDKPEKVHEHYPKGIPIRLTYAELSASIFDPSIWDQFECQREWTFQHVWTKSSSQETHISPENGLTYLQHNIDFKAWT